MKTQIIIKQYMSICTKLISFNFRSTYERKQCCFCSVSTSVTDLVLTDHRSCMREGLLTKQLTSLIRPLVWPVASKHTRE